MPGATQVPTRDELREYLEALSQNAATRYDLWIRFIDHFCLRHALEVGVWKGAFAGRLLRRSNSIERYYMLDPWRRLEGWNKPFNVGDSEFEDIFREAIEATEFSGEKRVVLRGTTSEMIGQIPDASLDFAYIDGDHTLRGVTIDLISVFPKIKAGGFLAGDDLEPEIWKHGPDFEPTLVFPFAAHFAEAVGLPFFAMPFQQFLIAKLPGGYAFTDFTGQYQSLALREQLRPPK
jgi:hypothetical protein